MVKFLPHSASHTETFTLYALTLKRRKVVSLDDLNCCFDPGTPIVIFTYRDLCLCFISSLFHSYFFCINLSSTALLLSISFCLSYFYDIQIRGSNVGGIRFSKKLNKRKRQQ
jgi:hypothetical protein